MNPQSELEKAIESIAFDIRDAHNGAAICDVKDLDQLLSAAKRLKEYEADEDMQNKHKVDLIRERNQLRTDLNQCAKCLQTAVSIIKSEYGSDNWRLEDFKLALSL